MTGSRLIVLATGISVSGVETWVWKLATRLSGRGDGAESNYTENAGLLYWWRSSFIRPTSISRSSWERHQHQFEKYCFRHS